MPTNCFSVVRSWQTQAHLSQVLSQTLRCPMLGQPQTHSVELWILCRIHRWCNSRSPQEVRRESRSKPLLTHRKAAGLCRSTTVHVVALTTPAVSPGGAHPSHPSSVSSTRIDTLQSSHSNSFWGMQQPQSPHKLTRGFRSPLICRSITALADTAPPD